MWYKIPFWRRGCDSNAQCLAAHHISNVAPYQLEYLSIYKLLLSTNDIITKAKKKIK